MRYASVCSGIEAPTVAWHGLGWRAQWFSEIDPFPCHVLAHHYGSGRPLHMPSPGDEGLTRKERDARKAAIRAVSSLPEHASGVPNLGDMTKIRGDEHGSIDLLVGGTPCQSFSVAGLRKGMADPRGNLALVFLGIVDRARPRWVAWENVPGVLSSNQGRDFGAFLGALGQLGYGWSYRVLDAQFFGVPQRRRRVFVVGYLGDWRPPTAVLFERQGLSWHPAPRREAGEGSAARALCSTDGGIDREDRHTLIAHSLRAEGFDASEDGTGRGTPLVPVAFDTTQVTSKANRSNPQPGDPCHPIAAGAHAPAIAFQASQSGMRYTPAHPTLDSNNGSRRHHGVQQGMAVRRLTPRECERLQGFPDDYTLIEYRGKPAADGPRYKALGNSMAVPVMRWIGERITAVDQLTLRIAS